MILYVLFFIVSFFTLSESQNIQNTTKKAAIFTPITGTAATQLSLDPHPHMLSTPKHKIAINSVDNDTVTINVTGQSAHFPPTLLHHSALIKTTLEINDAGQTLSFPVSLKSVSLQELGTFLEIINAYKNTRTCKQKLQAVLNMYATPEKLADVCDVANYFDIQELLHAVVPMLAQQVFAAFKRKSDLFINRCSHIDPKIQHLICYEIMKYHPLNKKLLSNLHTRQHLTINNRDNSSIHMQWHPNNPEKLAVGISRINEHEAPIYIGNLNIHSDKKAECTQLKKRGIPRVYQPGKIAWHPTNPKLLACCCYGGSVKIWNVDTNTVIKDLYGNVGPLCEVVWQPHNSSILAAASCTCPIQIWNIDAQNPLIKTLDGYLYSSQPRHIKWHPKHSTILASHDVSDIITTIKIWDYAQENPLISELKGHTKAINTIEWHPRYNNVIISCSNDGTVRLWDIRHTNPLNILRVNHLSPIKNVSWHPNNGGTLAACTQYGTGYIWDASHVPIQTKRLISIPIKVGIHYSTDTVTWHPSKHNILISSAGDGVRIWNIDTQQCLQILPADNTTESNTTWHPTHPYILVSAERGTITIWNLSLFFAWQKTLKNLTINQTQRLLELYKKTRTMKTIPIRTLLSTSLVQALLDIKYPQTIKRLLRA